MPDMERDWSPVNKISRGTLGGDAATLPPNKQETAASLLDSCHKYASMISANTTAIAHGAGGPIPCDAEQGCEQPTPSLVNSLRQLRNYLASIADESQRARTILGL